jgi:hypothetical protein
MTPDYQPKVADPTRGVLDAAQELDMQEHAQQYPDEPPCYCQEPVRDGL